MDDWSSLGGSIVAPASGASPPSAPAPQPAANDPWASLGGSVVKPSPTAKPAAAPNEQQAAVKDLGTYARTFVDPGAAASYLWDETKQNIGGAIHKLHGDLDADAAAQDAALKNPGNFWDMTKRGLQGDARFAGLVGDVGGLLASVPGTLVHAGFIRPAADLATATGATPTKLVTGPNGKVQLQALPAQQTNEGILNTSLMGLGPEAGAGAEAAEAAPAGSGAAAPKPPGSPIFRGPMAAAVSKDAAELEAGRILQARATDPAAVRARLDQGNFEQVPGSVPNTAPLTADQGLLELEDEVRTRRPADFTIKAGEQNAAQLKALGDIKQGGSPSALAQGLNDNYAALEQAAEDHVNDLRQTAQAHLDSLGENVPEAYGDMVREALTEAEGRARKWEGGLHDAVDPDGTLTVNAQATSSGAKRILDEMPKRADPLNERDQSIFADAQSLDPLSPYSELAAVKSRVTTAMREEFSKNGKSQAYRRLSMLNDSIRSNLANSISQVVVNEAKQVAGGRMAAEDTVEARLQREVDGWRAARTGGDDGQAGAGASPSGGAGPGGGGVPAAGPAAEGLGNGQGAAGLSGDVAGRARVEPLEPDQQGQLTQAAQDYLSYRAGPGPRGGMFQAMKDLGGLRLRDGGGVLTPSGAEIDALLEGVRRPGLINGKSGLTPEAMQEALRERGWFGVDSDAWEAGANTAARGTDWNDFTELMRREAAGNTVFHPESGTPQRLEMQGALKQELDEAGVLPTDNAAAAIRKLAIARAARETQAADEARALVRLKTQADSMGVPYRQGVGYDELLGDVREREAIQAEGSRLDEIEAEIEQRLRPDQHDRHLDQLQGSLDQERGAPGVAAQAADGGIGPQGEGAPGPAGEGAGGGGAAAQGAADQGLTPSFDEDAVARKALADAATQMRARIFGEKPIRAVLKTAGDRTQFALSEGRVAAKFFHSGPGGFEDVQALQTAVGAEQANAILGDYAAMDLRRAAERPEGGLDPAKFASWRAKNQDALRALPEEMQQRFANAAEATAAVDKAVGERAAQLRAAKADALGQVMKLSEDQSVVNAVGSILNRTDGAERMAQLAQASANNPAAFEGLRQAVADHIAQKLVGNTPAGLSGTTKIKADAFQNFMRQKQAALAHVFTPDELASMQKVADDIAMNKLSESVVKNPGQSDTISKGIAQARSEAASSLLGHLLTAKAGPAGRIAYKGIGMLGGAIRQFGMSNVDELLSQALRDPEVAKRLMAKVPPPGAPGAPEATAKASNELARALRQANPQSDDQKQP